MTESQSGPHDPALKPVSVAELLARNGSVGSPPVTGHRRRRRGGDDEITVARLTGEIPIVSDADLGIDSAGSGATDDSAPADPPPEPAGPVFGRRSGFFPDQTGRFPKSPSQLAGDGTGPEHSHYPQPLRRPEFSTGGIPVPHPRAARLAPAPSPKAASRRVPGGSPSGSLPLSGAEQMVPDPIDGNGQNIAARRISVLGVPVKRGFRADRDEPEDTDNADDTREAGDGPTTSAPDDRDDPQPGAFSGYGVLDDDHCDIEGDLAGVEQPREPSWVFGGLLALLQSLLALALGAGLFVAFDQLWRWNVIVALALTAAVTVGMVAAVQAVRKTDDVVSTLIAVAVALLVTLGPLALNAS